MSEMVYFSSKTNVLVVLFKKLFLFTSKQGKKGCEVEVFHSKQWTFGKCIDLSDVD